MNLLRALAALGGILAILLAFVGSLAVIVGRQIYRVGGER